MKIIVFNQISKFVCKGSIDIKLVLVQVMAWCQMGTKPLPEPVLTMISIAI